MTERKQPSPFNNDWLSTFYRVSAEAREEINAPHMPTSKDEPFAFTILSEHWLNEDLFPPYYANRDVTKRLSKEHLNGVSTFAQLQVVAVFFNGGLLKIDGHSRAAAWNNDQMPKPRTLKVIIYKADTEKELAFIYNQFNSGASASNSREKTEHAQKLAHFEPKTEFTRKNWASAFGLIDIKYKGNEKKATVDLKEYLELLDGWDIDIKNKSHMYSAGTKGAILWSVITYGEAIKPFWDVWAGNAKDDHAQLAELKAEVTELKGKLGGQQIVGYIYNKTTLAITDYATKNGITK